MRTRFLIAATLALTACVVAPAMRTERITLTSADAATGLTAPSLTLTRSTPEAAPPEGQDPLVRMTLTHPDGRALAFTEANHTPHDVMAQSAGGPLATVMGFFAEETPTLYAANMAENSGAPFLCGPEGPAYVGVHTGADGRVAIVGLKRGFEFETRPDGVEEAVPFSPDQVCARLQFTRAS